VVDVALRSYVAVWMHEVHVIYYKTSFLRSPVSYLWIQ